jgi:predicted phage tail protein
MIKFRLEGVLADKFDDFSTNEFELEVRTVPEAIRILHANFKTVKKNFKNALRSLGEFAVVVGEDIHDPNVSYSPTSDMLPLEYKDGTTISLIHAPAGSKDSWWNVIIGVALIVVSFYVPGAWGVGMGLEYGAVAGMVYNLGAAMVFGGLLGVLQGTPDMPSYTEMETPAERPSYFMNGPKNTVESGHIIPYLFGKKVVLGSNVATTNVITGDIK